MCRSLDMHRAARLLPSMRVNETRGRGDRRGAQEQEKEREIVRESEREQDRKRERERERGRANEIHK